MKQVYAIVIFGIAALGGLLFITFRTPDSTPKISIDDIRKGGFQKPPATDTGDIERTFFHSCSDNSYRCFERELLGVVERNGPEPALELAKKIQERGLIPAGVDDHQLAHEIGRTTAKHFGAVGEAFLLCTTAFNYGCQHGFFEYILGRTASPREAASLICGTIEENPAYSFKFKFYCYHGLGHGVLMAQAYDLDAGLSICDSLSTPVAKDGCFQGVFMENVNAAMRGEAREGIFLKGKPLEPCGSIEKKYQHECFINHAGWLMHVFGNSVQDASKACSRASPENVSSCLQSIGLMVTNPVWQSVLWRGPSGEKFEIISWKLCAEFPSSYIKECVLGAVDTILNFDELNPGRAISFCTAVGESYRTSCFERMGSNFQNQSFDPASVRRSCSKAPESFRQLCLRGAGY